MWFPHPKDRPIPGSVRGPSWRRPVDLVVDGKHGMRGWMGQATAADRRTHLTNWPPSAKASAGVATGISWHEDQVPWDQRIGAEKPHPALANPALERVEGPPERSELFEAVKPLHDSRLRR